MAKLKILNYFISLLFVLLAFNSKGQKAEWKGLSVGFDLSRPITPLIDTTRYGWEVSGDFELMEDLFLVGEFGTQSTRFDKASYSYKSDGLYFRFGADYNYMKHLDPESTDYLLVGIRYAHSTFGHSASNINIENEIFGNYSGGTTPLKLLSSQWFEITTGMRAQIINNFYLGWNIRFRVKAFAQNDTILFPYHIPGFGRAWSNGRIGFNYSIYYKIPLIKKKKAAPEELQAAH